MYANDDDISMGSNPSPPSSAAQNAAMALAILGPNHRGNVTFEAIEEAATDDASLLAEADAAVEGVDPVPEAPVVTSSQRPPERLNSSIR